MAIICGAHARDIQSGGSSSSSVACAHSSAAPRQSASAEGSRSRASSEPAAIARTTCSIATAVSSALGSRSALGESSAFGDVRTLSMRSTSSSLIAAWRFRSAAVEPRPSVCAAFCLSRSYAERTRSLAVEPPAVSSALLPLPAEGNAASSQATYACTVRSSHTSAAEAAVPFGPLVPTSAATRCASVCTVRNVLLQPLPSSALRACSRCSMRR